MAKNFRSPPPQWCEDTCTVFIQNAIENVYASFVRLPDSVIRVIAINDLFSEATQRMDNTQNLLGFAFLVRSHSAFLAASQLALGGQHPEAYVLLRNCLEHPLYAFSITAKPALSKIWLQRDQNASSLSACKAAFQMKKMWAPLTLRDHALTKAAMTLYERTIELGAHPNEKAIFASLAAIENGEDIDVKAFYLAGPDELTAYRAALISVAQVGIASLSIFRHIFTTRFDMPGITDRIQKLKRNL